jgi:hypothetical protein
MRRAPFLLIALASPAIAAPGPEASWGKAGVPFDQYRQDAVECGREGYYLDVSQTDAAKTLVGASKQLDAVTSSGFASVDPVEYANTQQRIVYGARPDKQFRDIKHLLQAKVDQCLTGRGYTKFRLTDDQRRSMKKLKVGSPERHAYLYSLASNPTVLATQVEPVAKSEQ